MDDNVLSLDAKGMTTRKIVATFKELYGADVSATLISRITDSVIGILEYGCALTQVESKQYFISLTGNNFIFNFKLF